MAVSGEKTTAADEISPGEEHHRNIPPLWTGGKGVGVFVIVCLVVVIGDVVVLVVVVVVVVVLIFVVVLVVFMDVFFSNILFRFSSVVTWLTF